LQISYKREHGLNRQFPEGPRPSACRQRSSRPGAAFQVLLDGLPDFENAEGHKRQAGEPFYEVARLRAELGLKE
jgi:hypothetical protein